jgi:peptide/nickel transport system permease protein
VRGNGPGHRTSVGCAVIGWLVRRVAAGIAVLVAVSSIVFVLTRVFTDPARAALPLYATDDQLNTLRKSLGLNAPLWEQYWDFLRSLPTLQFGDSYWQKLPAVSVVLDRLPNTLQLMACAILIAVVSSIVLGAVAARYAGRWPDHVIVGFGLLGVSAPQFWVAYLLIIVFSIQLDWLPSTGTGGTQHLILPSLALAIYSAGRLTQFVRQAIVNGLREPYVLTAESRGFGPVYAITHHVVRNVLADFVTVSGWEVTRMLSGATIVVEVIFGWPGIGQLLVDAINQKDLVLLQVLVLVIAALVVLMNLVIDILRRVIDPRLAVAR